MNSVLWKKEQAKYSKINIEHCPICQRIINSSFKCDTCKTQYNISIQKYYSYHGTIICRTWKEEQKPFLNSLKNLGYVLIK